jgi:hypothetical protein
VAADAHRSRVVNDLHWMTVAEAASAIAARKLSPVELMKALLERIGRLDPKLNAFIRLDGDAALDAARAAEAEIASGRQRGPLHGVPVGIKDIIDVAGLPTTCHSKLLIDNIASTDSVAPRPQSVEYRPSPGRLVLGLRFGPGGGAVRDGAWQRHRRERAQPSQRLRDRRVKTNVWPGLTTRCLPTFLHS